jgi:hypothetical protein
MVPSAMPSDVPSTAPSSQPSDVPSVQPVFVTLEVSPVVACGKAGKGSKSSKAPSIEGGSCKGATYTKAPTSNVFIGLATPASKAPATKQTKRRKKKKKIKKKKKKKRKKKARGLGRVPPPP